MGLHGSTRAPSVAQAYDGGSNRIRRRGQRIGAVRLGASSSTWQRLEVSGRISRERDRHPAQDVAGRLIGSQAVPCFDLVNHKPIEATEVSLHESAINVYRLLKLLCNYGSRRDRPDQRARNTAVDGDASEALRCCMGLSDARCV
jgi:hypothetical protein